MATSSLSRRGPAAAGARQPPGPGLQGLDLGSLVTGETFTGASIDLGLEPNGAATHLPRPPDGRPQRSRPPSTDAHSHAPTPDAQPGPSAHHQSSSAWRPSPSQPKRERHETRNASSSVGPVKVFGSGCMATPVIERPRSVLPAATPKPNHTLDWEEFLRRFVWAMHILNIRVSHFHFCCE
jgi:hypothetical protein